MRRWLLQIFIVKFLYFPDQSVTEKNPYPEQLPLPFVQAHDIQGKYTIERFLGKMLLVVLRISVIVILDVIKIVVVVVIFIILE